MVAEIAVVTENSERLYGVLEGGRSAVRQATQTYKVAQ